MGPAPEATITQVVASCHSEDKHVDTSPPTIPHFKRKRFFELKTKNFSFLHGTPVYTSRRQLRRCWRTRATSHLYTDYTSRTRVTLCRRLSGAARRAPPYLEGVGKVEGRLLHELHCSDAVQCHATLQLPHPLQRHTDTRIIVNTVACRRTADCRHVLVGTRLNEPPLVYSRPRFRCSRRARSP